VLGHFLLHSQLQPAAVADYDLRTAHDMLIRTIMTTISLPTREPHCYLDFHARRQFPRAMVLANLGLAGRVDREVAELRVSPRMLAERLLHLAGRTGTM